MEIYNNTSLAFGNLVRTATVLEAVTFKYTESESIADLKPFINEFWHTPIKATGNKGYRYFIQDIAQRIKAKYPEIQKAADDILEFANKNPRAKKADYKEFVKPIIEKLGETIDINI